MSTKAIDEQINIADMVRALAQAYEEVAVMQMQKIRDGVLNARNFYDEISKVYVEVKMSYVSEILKIHKKDQRDKSLLSFSTLNKNGKELALLIMPDERLSGKVGYLIFDQFIHYVEKREVDIVIVGSLGRILFESHYAESVSEKKREYKYFDTPKIGEIDAIKPIINQIINYETINVFHGKFLNLVKQEATRSNITGEFDYKGDESKLEQRHYLFEPSLEKVLNFFEVQILVYVLQQTFSESQLAKLGSRINAMEISTRNAEDLKKKLMISKRIIQKSINNKKQLQRIAGMSVWGGLQ